MSTTATVVMGRMMRQSRSPRNPGGTPGVRSRMKCLPSVVAPRHPGDGVCLARRFADHHSGTRRNRDADGILTIAPGTADGPGITIAEALGSGGGQPLLVNGALFVDPEEGVLLCDAVAESFPPQCGGLRLEVRGLDLGALPGLEEANGVRWAEQVQLLGTLTPIDQ